MQAILQGDGLDGKSPIWLSLSRPLPPAVQLK